MPWYGATRYKPHVLFMTLYTGYTYRLFHWKGRIMYLNVIGSHKICKDVSELLLDHHSSECSTVVLDIVNTQHTSRILSFLHKEQRQRL